jgi:hypothetical protein
MWKLEFLPADSRSWVDSLPLGGYPMLGEPFDNPGPARAAAFMLRECWPDLLVRVIEVEG